MRYKQIQKDTQNTCRNAHNNYIRNIFLLYMILISESGSENKKLYSYVKGSKCDSSGVATLQRDGTNYSEASDKAVILNDQFVSAFTSEDCSNMPSMGNSLKSEAQPLVIKNNGVKRIPVGLNPHKASGRSKAMEHIIHSHLTKYLDNHHILNDRQQHGFRKKDGHMNLSS